MLRQMYCRIVSLNKASTVQRICVLGVSLYKALQTKIRAQATVVDQYTLAPWRSRCLETRKPAKGIWLVFEGTYLIVIIGCVFNL